MIRPGLTEKSRADRQGAHDRCNPLRRGPNFQADHHRANHNLGARYDTNRSVRGYLRSADHQRGELYRILWRRQNQTPFPRKRSPRRHMVRRQTMPIRHLIHRDPGLSVSATTRAFTSSGHFRFRRLRPPAGRNSNVVSTEKLDPNNHQGPLTRSG